MNLLFAAASGHGKSWAAQATAEENMNPGGDGPDDAGGGGSAYDGLVVLDLKDEFRGLVKGGYAKHWLAGERELESFSRDTWRQAIDDNRRLVIGREASLAMDEWREMCADIIAAARATGLSLLFVIDEAHFVAPQRQKLLPPVKALATTGRGEQLSAIWVTQRLTELDEVIISQCTARMLGGFESEQDLKKFRSTIEYPADVHLSGGSTVPGLPEALHAPDDGAVSVRKFLDEDGDLYGSEWIYSDDTGAVERQDTREWEMDSPHLGAQGKDIRMPG